MWKKDNSPIATGDFLLYNDQNNRIKLEQFCHGQGNKLVISLAEPSDTGEYSCVISHKTTLPVIKHKIQVQRKKGLLFKITLFSFFGLNFYDQRIVIGTSFFYTNLRGKIGDLA